MFLERRCLAWQLGVGEPIDYQENCLREIASRMHRVLQSPPGEASSVSSIMREKILRATDVI